MGIKIGDKNEIKKSNIIENADITIELKDKPKNGIFKQVFVNILSNLLWKILGIIASFGLLVLFAYLCSH